VTNALRELIEKICHIYLDDIVIWSNSVDEHIRNVRKVMKALLHAKLYVNEKKTKLFCYKMKFLGHKISQAGIEADDSKVSKILDWPVPKSASDVRAFLVHYLNVFLATQSEILNRLTTKECEKNFPCWSTMFQEAFKKIKNIVVSHECLTVIDHNKLSTNKIFVTADASNTATGAVLSFGPTWESARPVAFDSKTLKDAELNYPTHEKELLAILHAIRKWKVDLLGSPFFVYTDHKTLLNFHTQHDLSKWQAHWVEELSIYHCSFVYIKGRNNTVADTLSRYPCRQVTTPDLRSYRFILFYTTPTPFIPHCQ
jgi:RNase H-like domain found in reverse transcriptase/Reverse transcriptase (RNA-dependent DNA polymerase)